MLSLSLAHFAKEVEKKKSETKLNELKKSNEEIEKIGMDIAISYEKSQGRTLSYSKPC